MTTIDIKDIDAATYVATACAIMPEILRDQFDGQAVFEFEQRPEIHAAMVDYATGAAMIQARRLLSVRRRLFYEIRKVTGGAR